MPLFNGALLKKNFNNLLKKNDFDLEKLLKKFAAETDLHFRSYKIKRIFMRPFSLIVNVRLLNDASMDIFIKIYKQENNTKFKDNLLREYQITEYWFNKFKKHRYFHTIEPVWLNMENQVIITREASGINLLSFLEHRIMLLPSEKSIRKAVFYLSQAGQWLAYFQKHEITDDIPYLDRSVKINIDYFLDYISIRMNRMVQNKKIKFDRTMQNQVIKTIGRLWERAGSYKNSYSVSHSDFSLSNILVAQKHVTVLDFHSSEINSPLKDLSRLYHQLYLLSFKPIYQDRIIKKLQHALLSGWGDENVNNDPLFRIYFLMHQMNHLGKIARYWEHNFVENIYNRLVVKKSLQHLTEFLAHESQAKN